MIDQLIYNYSHGVISVEAFERRLDKAMDAQANSWENESKDAWIDGKAETVLLMNTDLNNFDINTDVTNGKVVLTGKVDSEVEKELAEELVLSLDGVMDVENSLTVVKNTQWR